MIKIRRLVLILQPYLTIICFSWTFITNNRARFSSFDMRALQRLVRLRIFFNFSSENDTKSVVKNQVMIHFFLNFSMVIISSCSEFTITPLIVIFKVLSEFLLFFCLKKHHFINSEGSSCTLKVYFLCFFSCNWF